jgi:hypothetical protein
MIHTQHLDQPAAWARETELLAEGFQRYRTALDALPHESSRPLVVKPGVQRHLTMFTPVDGWGTVAEAHLGFMLTNEVNIFGQGLVKLAAWARVLDAADIDEKHELLLEFVSPLAAQVLNLPFALKNRFAFAAMRLSDEANRLCNKGLKSLERTTDDMKAPKWDLLWRYGEPWTSCTRVQEAVEKIFPGGGKRVSLIDTYRDRFVHRIPRYIGLGILEKTLVERNERGWIVTTNNLPPLDLFEIVRELTPAHDACQQAHAALCALADEQWQHVRLLLDRSGSKAHA